MLGGIGIAEVVIFLILAWTAAFAAVAAVVLYWLRLRVAFAIVSSLGFFSLALAVWAYFSIWGYVWFR